MSYQLNAILQQIAVHCVLNELGVFDEIEIEAIGILGSCTINDSKLNIEQIFVISVQVHSNKNSQNGR